MCAYCKMWNGVVVECVISCIVFVYCYGKPVAEPQDVQKSELDPLAHQLTVQKLYSLLNESLLKETLSGFSKNDEFTSNPPNEVLFTSRPLPSEAVETNSKSTTSYPVLEERFNGNIGEHSKFVTRSASEYKAQKPTFAGKFSSPAEPSLAASIIKDRLKETTPTSASASSKSPLDYNPQKPSFAGTFSSGQLGQLIPPGKPWPANPSISSPVLEDRFQDTSATTAQSTSDDKSPLEYNPQKPSFAGTFSSGQLGQLIPPGKPWPANPPISTPLLEDRFQDTSPTTAQSTSDDKSPLEYNPQKPSFAGTFSSGQLGQLIPPGKPWPANPPISTPLLEDRFQDTSPTTAQSTSDDKSPLEYNPQKPSFAGTFSSGQLGQLIPPGKPWPANPPISTPLLEDRFQDTTSTPSQSTSADKSPLEYDPQKPSFAGNFSSGQLGQLIPPGKPWPADPPISTPLLEDRFQDTTSTPSQSTSTDKSPLEYNPQKPSFAGSFSSGQLGQLIPPGKPWPADPPISKPLLEDRFQDNIATSSQSTSDDQSPLDYNPQKPSFAGTFSSGQLGQLIPPGKPWPANPPISTPVLEDRFQGTTSTPPQSTSADTSPLEYNPQKPSFAGSFSSGQLGQLIPPGKPWPANPAISTPLLEDRFQDTSPTPAQSTFADESPLEYNPQKPSFAGSFSSGQLGQLIPPGNPWPADPPIPTRVIKARFQETTPQFLVLWYNP